MIAIVVSLFILGLAIGSFLNVLIPRSIWGEDWVRGRSRCPNCKREIAWYDNIPLLSYLVLRGKCRKCRKRIAAAYPAIELVTAMLFVWWYAVGFAFFQLSQQPLVYIQPIFWLVVGLLLLIIFITDWIYQIIPDYAVIALGILALSYRFYLSFIGVMQWRDFGLAMMSGFMMMAFLWFLWWVTRGRGLGFGDVKYALVMGWLLGWPRSLVAFFLAFMIGAVVGIVLMVLGKKSMKSKIAFGPFLVLGTGIALVYGIKIWEWYVGLMV